VDFFKVPNPSGSIMALGSTQPLTEMNTRVKSGRRVRLSTLPPSVSRESRKNVGASTSQWAFTACYSDSFTFYFRCSSLVFSDTATTPGQAHYSVYCPRGQSLIPGHNQQHERRRLILKRLYFPQCKFLHHEQNKTCRILDHDSGCYEEIYLLE
jgi:hypothetical protein